MTRVHETTEMKIIHHGAYKGVTGSCHEMVVDSETSLLIDCGLFQGAEVGENSSSLDARAINFPIDQIQALLVTHCHIDHVGRVPYLLAAGFRKKIYCTEATAKLLPLVMEDALRIGFTKDKSLIRSFLQLISELLVPLPYGKKTPISSKKSNHPPVQIKFKPAGHILGSAYIEIWTQQNNQIHKTIFSGDLGAPYTPLLPAPKSPYSCDLLVLESTYGDKNHQGRKKRRQTLRKILKQSLKNRGTVLIPAFSIGRTQELLYEIEQIIHQFGKIKVAGKLRWEDLDVIIDSPLAAKFTEVYKELKPFWDKEALNKIHKGRHPLSFEQLLTINSHQEHLRTINYLKNSGRPAIVIAASGMCTGGRILNYLKALIEDEKTDILFVGYQGKGTPGRVIQKYGPREGYVLIEGKQYTIKAGIHTISGYSAHADQNNLINFVTRMRKRPQEIRLVHGENYAKEALSKKLHHKFPEIQIT